MEAGGGEGGVVVVGAHNCGDHLTWRMAAAGDDDAAGDVAGTAAIVHGQHSHCPSGNCRDARA